MTLKLILGVLDVPYGHSTEGTTTGEVAGYLENKYHIMEVFAELHQHDIAKDLEDAIGGALENMLMGAPPSTAPFKEGTDNIESAFKKFLDTKEMEGLGIPGVPTGAALRGVNHRLKHPYKKRGARPSFVDTGEYQNSMKAWIEDK